MPFTLKLPRRAAASTDAMHDSIAARPLHWRRENFIPLRNAELTDLLAGQTDLSAQDRAAFEQFARLLTATFHYEFQLRLEDLKNAYAVFDPDADTKTLRPFTPEQRQARMDGLFTEFTKLLERANFQHIGRKEIEAAIEGGASDLE